MTIRVPIETAERDLRSLLEELCIIRPMPTIDSDACRPPVPEHADQQFRRMATTFSWSPESVVALLRN